MKIEPKLLKTIEFSTCKIFKDIYLSLASSKFASQPQEIFVKFLLLLRQRFIGCLKLDFFCVKLGWLGN